MTPRARSGLALGAAIGAAAVAIAAAGAVSRPAAAKAVQRAGLVVQLGADDVRTFCIAFAEPSISGEELLRRSGLAVSAEIGVLGTLVCRIDDVGCDHPREACWCRCRTLGAGCTYWGYSTLDGDRWVYSAIGAHARVVRDGDVDGWAWGAGAIATGAMPPLRTFDDLCAAPPTPAPVRPAPTAGAATASAPPPPSGGAASPPHPTPPSGAGRAADAAAPTHGGPTPPHPAAVVAGDGSAATAATTPERAGDVAARASGVPTTAAAPPSDAPNTPSAPGRDRDVDDRPPGEAGASSRPGTGGKDGSVAAMAPRAAAADRAALIVYAGLVAVLAAAAVWVRRRS